MENTQREYTEQASKAETNPRTARHYNISANELMIIAEHKDIEMPMSGDHRWDRYENSNRATITG